MADIFNEIDEELRGDQMRRVWRAYSGLFVLIAVLIVVGVAGWRGWEYWAQQTAKADGDKYLAALQLSTKGDYQGAEDALKGLSTTGNAGYRTLAKLRGADELGLAGKQAEALAAYDAIAKDSSVPDVFKGLASIRAAYLALDLEDRDKLEARVKPMTVAGNPWRHAAREIMAISAWKADDIDGAKSWVDQIQNDAETPADLSTRITVLSSVIAAAKKSGITPAPLAPSAANPAVPAPILPGFDAPRPDAPSSVLQNMMTPIMPPAAPPAPAPETAPATPAAPAAKVE